jgi:hypothetical protein
MDSHRLGLNHAMLSDPISMNGMGGASDAHPLRAELAFVTGGHSCIYDLSVLIAIPTPPNGLAGKPVPMCCLRPSGSWCEGRA